MGKIIASYLLKVHLHAPDLLEAPPPGGDTYPPEPPTIDELKATLADGLGYELGGTWTVSLAEKTDD